MSRKINGIHKKIVSHTPESEVSESPENLEDSQDYEEYEEYEVEPIEIPDVFPEELSEDMETDIPDAPEPKPEKKGFLQRFWDFFRNNLFEEVEETEQDSDPESEPGEDPVEDPEEDLEIDSENPENPGEFQEIPEISGESETYPEYAESPENPIDLENPENLEFPEFAEDSGNTENFEVPEIPENPENPAIPDDSEIDSQIDPQRFFPDLEQSGFPETSDGFLPDPEFMDDFAELPTPEYFEEFDAIDLPDLPEDPTEFVDAPEIMPDGMVTDPEHMIFIPDEIAFAQDEDIESGSELNSESNPETEAGADPDQDQDQNPGEDSKPKPRILGKVLGVLAGVACVAGIVIAFRNGAFDEKTIYYMPDLTGENLTDYQNELQLDFQIEHSELTAYEKDVIYHQDIPAGVEIKPGQTVGIDVSLGLATAIVPDVRNYQLAYAEKTLEQAGFRTEIQYEMSQGGTQSGNVIRTEPAIGQEVTIDQPVIVYVSQGSDNQVALVPDVVGLDLETARIMCEEAGLMVETEAVPSLEAENTVVAQSLDAHTQVNFDTMIVLSYSNSEQPEGTINYQLQFPAYSNGRFVLDFIDEEGTVVASSTIVVGFSAGSDIPVPGHGSHQIRVVLNNEATTEQATIGTYQFDFPAGTYEIISEDVQSAFEAVNGIG